MRVHSRAPSLDRRENPATEDPEYDDEALARFNAMGARFQDGTHRSGTISHAASRSA